MGTIKKTIITNICFYTHSQHNFMKIMIVRGWSWSSSILEECILCNFDEMYNSNDLKSYQHVPWWNLCATSWKLRLLQCEIDYQKDPAWYINNFFDCTYIGKDNISVLRESQYQQTKFYAKKFQQWISGVPVARFSPQPLTWRTWTCLWLCSRTKPP